MLANSLKPLEDLGDFVPWKVCNAIDMSLNSILASQAGRLGPINSAIASLEETIGAMNKPPGQSQEDFAAGLYADCQEEMPTPVDPGFGTPISSYPSYCMNEATFDDVDSLADQISDRLTYRNCLEE